MLHVDMCRGEAAFEVNNKVQKKKKKKPRKACTAHSTTKACTFTGQKEKGLKYSCVLAVAQ